MSNSYVLALDQGTTSSRALLVAADGGIAGVSARETRQIYPRPGWVEHDPLDIWDTQLWAARDVLGKSGVSPAQVAAIGITNQRETTIAWDRRTGRPVHNAIVWQCRRTAEMCEALKARGLEALIRARTGLVLDAYFSGTKLAWLMENVPEAARLATDGNLCFGTVDTWLIWNLTGGRVFATDFSNASRTLLFNIHTLDWDDEILAALGIPRSVLPEVRPSSGTFGQADEKLLGAALPIAGVAGDQQAALFGHGCFEGGSSKNTYGTGCFLLMNTGDKPVASQHGLLTTIAWGLPRGQVQYALEGSVFIAGAAVQWLRDGLRIITHASETEALARSVADTGGVYFVPAFAGLGAPYWDMYARGTLVGVTRGTARAHLVRAALEAIAYQTRDVMAAMEKDSSLSLATLQVDGGATANDFLMQFQADLLGVPVVRPRATEVTALGAAYLAGLAVGVWTGLESIKNMCLEERRFEPAASEERRESLYSGWRRAVAAARAWASNAEGSAQANTLP